MRRMPNYIFAFALVVAVAGFAVIGRWSGSSGIAGAFPPGSTTVTGTKLPWPISLLTPSGALSSPRTAGASAAAANATDPALATVQAVIQKANEEQQAAFASKDPSAMADTATTAYYNQMAQTNQDLATSGVSAIKLLNLQWGNVTLQSATTAQATTTETWQTTYTGGSVLQSTDLNDYTLVQIQGAWKIQADDQPTANPTVRSSVTSPSPAAPIGPSSTVPPVPSGLAGQSNVSRNWSGYSATGGAFTAVSGTWTVPASQGSGSTGTRGVASGATWVGIGGVQTRDLIQAGTEETVIGSQGVQYDAWIETLPQASHPIPLAVNPGDSVTVSVSQRSTNQWLIAFKDNTTGQTYQTTVQYQSSQSSAEWVVEAPSAGRGVLPLDNFGTIAFSGGSAIENGKSVTIAQAGAQPITMIDSSRRPQATPSALTSDGQGFTVSRVASTGNSVQPGTGGFPQFPGGVPSVSIGGID